MRLRMKNLSSLKVRRYATRLIDIKNNLVVFPGEKASDKTFFTELDEIVLNRRPNIWIKQAYLQGCYC